jgi:hypothetical protein
MKAREAMQQSRREAQLSRQRLEEECLKSKQKKDTVCFTLCDLYITSTKINLYL